MNLNGKTVLITGASAGIGEDCAHIFAEAGAKLILMARREEKLQALNNTIKEKYGMESHCISCDVRNYDEVKQSIDNIPDDFKDIDILINNAGLARGLDKLHEGLLSDWEEMIDTNVKGLLYVSRILIPMLAAKKDGHVINIGSIAGHEVYSQRCRILCQQTCGKGIVQGVWRLT